MKKRVSVSVSAINPYGYVLNDYVSEKDYKKIQFYLSHTLFPDESSDRTLESFSARLGSLNTRIKSKGDDKFLEYLSKPDLFVVNDAVQHPLLPISRFEILRTFSDWAIPNVDINVGDVGQNQQLTQFFRVSVATHDYLATEYRALEANVASVLTVTDPQASIRWDALDKPAIKAHSQWGLLKEWNLLIQQCPSSDGLIEYKKTLALLVANIFLERERLQEGLEGPIARVMGTESEFESLSNHLLNTVAAPSDGTDTRIRAESQRSFWADTFFSQSFKTGSSFLEWDAANKSGATILSVLGISFLDRECDVHSVCDVINKSVEQFFSVDDAGQLTAHHTMTSLLAMLKAASSQCSDGGVEIRNVVARSKLGEAVRTDIKDKVFGDAFSRCIFGEFNEILSAGTPPNEVAGKNSTFLTTDDGVGGNFANFAKGTLAEVDNFIGDSRQSVFTVTTKQFVDVSSDSDSDSTSGHSDGNLGEFGYQIFADKDRRSVHSGASNRSSRSNSVDYAIDVISESSQLLVQTLLTPPIDNSLDLSPGSSDWWRNLNERIQSLCEKLKEIDSRTHFLAPLLKQESSAVTPKPVLAKAPLRKIRTGVPLKNNGENSGNKNVQSFNNRRRFSRGFFSRLFPRIRV